MVGSSVADIQMEERSITKESVAYRSREGDLPTWEVHCGDSRHILKCLPEKSVNCVVTSPPYYWQRDYGVEGQIGQEDSIDGYVRNIVETFAGLWRVLKDDGVVFLNLGDTYYSAKGRPHGRDDKHKERKFARKVLRAVDGPGLGLPRKSLIGIPWRTALALAEAGWTLRSEIIWEKRTSLPEPTARDRPWRQHEHIFLFSKSPRYWFRRDGLAGEETVWHIEPDRNSASRGKHYAPFPYELVRRCISAGCPADGVVLDPFAGGGTTLAVAKDMGINSIGVELNPEFCELIEHRLREPDINRLP